MYTNGTHLIASNESPEKENSWLVSLSRQEEWGSVELEALTWAGSRILHRRQQVKAKYDFPVAKSLSKAFID